MRTASPNLGPAPDPAGRIGSIRRAHERFVHSGEATGVRAVVAESWHRCRDWGVDPDRTLAPVQLSAAELRSHRERSPLAALLPLFRELLGRIATEARHLMAVGDADARLLWVEGHPVLRRRAERVNFVEGAVWNERRAGTNAPGTAMALNRPVQIVATEHYCQAVQPWTCSAAPVRDPHTHDVLGFVDLTGGDHLASPASLALVRAVALAAEGELARMRAARTIGAASAAPRPGHAGVARLDLLGRDRGNLTLGTEQWRLSLRHSEILAVLAQRTDGFTGGQLGVELYGDKANPVTLRAEMVRLRRLLGGELLGSRPYRLRTPVATDAAEVMRLVERGSMTDALNRYRGPVLPMSQAPGVERMRRRVEQQIRAGLVGAADPAVLLRWSRTQWGSDDLEIWELLARIAPAGAVRSLAAREARRLAAE
jgi:GAF domain